MATTPRTPRSRGEETAVYWFARLVSALSQDDYLLATEARNQLRRLGYSIGHRSHRLGRRVADES